MIRKTSQPDAAWGLHVGQAARLVRLVRCGEGYRVDRSLRAPLGEGPEPLVEAVRRLQFAPTPEPLVVCLPDELVLFRMLSLPDTAPAAMEKIIRAQCEALLPAQAELFAWGWRRMGADGAGDASMHQVALCAARRDVLRRFSDVGRALAQQPCAVVPAAHALAAGCARLAEPDAPATALLAVGRQTTSLTLLHGRWIANGGLVEHGSEHWSPAGDGPADWSDSGDAADAPAGLTAWAQQVRAAYDQIVADLPAERRPRRCVLFGDSERLSLAANRVRQALGLPAHLAGAPERLELPEGASYPALAGAIGGALCGLQEDLPGVCRLAAPAAPAVVRKRPALWRWTLAAGWLVAAAAVLVRMDLSRADWMDGQVEQVRRIAAAVAGDELPAAIAGYLEQGAPAPLAVLDEISSLAPSQAMLASWRYSRTQEIVIGGTIPNEAELHQYMTRLAASPLFRDVGFLSARQESGKLQFELALRPAAGARQAASSPASQPASRADSEPAATPAPDTSTGAAPPSSRTQPSGSSPADAPASSAAGGPSPPTTMPAPGGASEPPQVEYFLDMPGAVVEEGPDGELRVAPVLIEFGDDE